MQHEDSANYLPEEVIPAPKEVVLRRRYQSLELEAKEKAETVADPGTIEGLRHAGLAVVPQARLLRLLALELEAIAA